LGQLALRRKRQSHNLRRTLACRRSQRQFISGGSTNRRGKSRWPCMARRSRTSAPAIS